MRKVHSKKGPKGGKKGEAAGGDNAEDDDEYEYSDDNTEYTETEYTDDDQGSEYTAMTAAPEAPATGATEERTSEQTEEVVNFLHNKYETYEERVKDYSNLFFFLVFGVIYITMLALERSTNDSYQVQNTLNSRLIPEEKTMASLDEVTSWFEDTLTATWKDPTCGDGLCEEPFEFPRYSQFGCRADCGDMSSRFQLEKLQVDLKWDFSHARGTPSTDLMGLAKWNLCPAESGSEKPPHGADCYYKEDQGFDRVKGDCYGSQCPAPLILTDVPAGSWEVRVKGDVFHKITGAVRSNDNVTLDSDKVKQNLAQLAARRVADEESRILTNASKYMTMSTEELVYTTKKVQLDFLQGAIQRTLITPAEAQLKARQAETPVNDTLVAQAQGVVDEYKNLYDEALTNFTRDVKNIYLCRGMKVAINDDGTMKPVGESAVASKPGDAVCASESFDAEEEFKLLNSTWDGNIRLSVLERRKLSEDNGTAYLDTLMADLSVSDPTVHREVAAALGTRAFNVRQASVKTLWADFVLKIYDQINAQAGRARDFLITSRVRSESFEAIAPKASERATELAYPTKLNITSPSAQYNYTAFEGGRFQYLTCALADRAPEYVGTCFTATDIDKISLPATDNDKEKLMTVCNKICDCKVPTVSFDSNGKPNPNRAGCDAAETCTCTACIPEGATMPTSSRKLLQEQDSVNKLLTSMDRLTFKQGELESSVNSLKEEVEKSARSSEAAQRDMETRLKAVMDQGWSELKTGQTLIQTKLDDIIGKQKLALAAAERANELARQSNKMLEQQAENQKAINLAVEEQLKKINEAAQRGPSNGGITEEQRRNLIILAEANRMDQLKRNLLANLQCEVTPRNYDFTVKPLPGAGYISTANTTRFRLVGLTNRVVAGMMLHTTRVLPKNCTDERFKNLDNKCTGPPTLAAYGVDPVFKLGSSLYNADLDNEVSITGLYNCSYAKEIRNGLYCREFYNVNDVPYGFFHRKLEGYPDGFFVWFDINLSGEGAEQYLNYVKDGLFLDGRTQTVRTQVVTYNPLLQLFGNVEVEFEIGEGGLIHVSHATTTLDVELFSTSGDKGRLALEIIFGISLLFGIINEAMDLIRAKRKFGKYSAYFESLWNYIDVLNIALLVVGYLTWWTYAAMASAFDVELRYDVYRDLDAPARMLRLDGTGKKLDNLVKMYADMNSLSTTIAFYYAVSGLNIILYLLRVLKLMHFQPRLGVVTRTLIRAASDLFHFFILFFVIFFGYAGLGHLVFGNTIESFATMQDSIMTCFEFLLGEIGVKEDLKQLSGKWSYAAGVLFFWTYALLVFMILLNFVLAIIVDAYSEIKEESKETTGILEEIGEIFADTFKRNMRRCGMFQEYIPNNKIRQMLEAWKKGVSLEQIEEEEKNKKDDDTFVPTEKKIKIGDQEVTVDELSEMLRNRIADNSLDRSSLTSRKKQPASEVVRRAAQTIVDRFGSDLDLGDDDDDEEDEPDRSAELEALAKQVLEEQQQLASLQESILRQQHVILHAIGQHVSASLGTSNVPAARGGAEGFKFDMADKGENGENGANGSNGSKSPSKDDDKSSRKLFGIF